MHAFIAPGAVKQATLQMVAPGIAEALIATAIGLFAAIPAVMAYNRLNQRVNKLELNYDNFMEEFTAILHRQAFTVSESNKVFAPERVDEVVAISSPKSTLYRCWTYCWCCC